VERFGAAAYGHDDFSRLAGSDRSGDPANFTDDVVAIYVHRDRLCSRHRLA